MNRKAVLPALILALFTLLSAVGVPGIVNAAAVQKSKASPVPVKAASAPSMAVPSVSGALSVKGTHLTDQAGNPVQLRGVSTHGIAWYPEYINEDCFHQLREEWHVNAVRLAVYTEEYGGYCSGGDQNALKSLIHKGVACAVSQDLYVIIDWHILSDGDPNRHLDEAKAFFAEMSAQYAGCPNVLYEICNEPNGGVNWQSIKSYAEAVTGVIRANDENAVILVGTPNWSQFVDQAAADPITAYQNIMYTLHFYAATHTDALRSTMTAAIEKGLPIFVSEFGICGASGNGAVNEAQADQWIQTLDLYGVSYLAWNLSNKAESSALLQSGCAKTSGFQQEDLSVSGKWLYRTLTRQREAGTHPSASARPAVSAPSTGNSSAVVLNQWQSNGECFYHYAVTVQNKDAEPCKQWEISISFNGPFTLQDCWNGNYTTSGNTLRISSKDYNGSIPAGGSIEGPGFIVKGGAGLCVMDCG